MNYLHKKVIFINFFLLTLCLSLSFAQAPEVTHIYPNAGINEQSITAHIYGTNFIATSSVKLIKAGYPDIDGASINVVSNEYLTCSFDLIDDSTGLYDLVVTNVSGEDTLFSCFTVYSSSVSPYMWKQITMGAGGNCMFEVTVGDGNNDGEMEVYGTNYDRKLYQFKWNGTSWDSMTVGSGGGRMYGLAVGDGNGDGELEVYGANADYKIYQFTWNGISWDTMTVGSGSDRMFRIAVGDGDGDGEIEVYGANLDYNLYQFTWNGVSWDTMTVGSAGSFMYGVAVEDGNGDGEMEVYGASYNHNIYQFTWNGMSWDSMTVGSGASAMYQVAVGDGDGDGDMEVYGTNGDDNLYQYTWNGVSWDSMTVGSGTSYMYGVVVGDGDGDGEMEVYGTNYDYNLYQFKWNGVSWDMTTVGSGEDGMYGAAIGDGNRDGEMEVYGANADTKIYQFKPIPLPIIVLSDTSHDFGSVPVGDSLDWQYLIIKNAGNDTLFVDSLITDNTDYIVTDAIFPDTILPNDSTLVTVRFKPSIDDTIFGTLVVHSDDPYDPVINVSLIGIGIDLTPPIAFGLVLPPDSSALATVRPTFLWEASFDSLSGLRDYEVYIDDTLRSTTVDTSWTADYDLSEGWHNWYIVVYDSIGNSQQSNQIWVIEIDTTLPETPILLSPLGGIYLSDTVVSFEWTQVTFAKSGVTKDGFSKDKEPSLPSTVQYIFELDTLDNFVSPIIIDTFNTINTTLNLLESFYYWHIKAFDLAGNESTYSNPDSFGVDITAPLIDSTTVWPDTSYAGPFPVYTKVTDNVDVDTVLLFFRRMEDPDWWIFAMDDSGAGWYYGEIAQAFLPGDTIKYYVYARDIAEPANESTDPPVAPINYYWFIANYTGIQELETMPQDFSFGLNGNPTRGKVLFNLALPEDAVIILNVYDVMGRLIDKPIAGRMSAGIHKIPLSQKVSAGVYFYSLESPWQKKIGKLVLLK
ncbi:MAG: hypothetical protein JSV97_03605 [candidate division WOR-3 bacterium]|nr:MAG: hypothetical protein JSV97_03605 [candidate division WOR-3 bacterium]